MILDSTSQYQFRDSIQKIQNEIYNVGYSNDSDHILSSVNSMIDSLNKIKDLIDGDKFTLLTPRAQSGESSFEVDINTLPDRYFVKLLKQRFKVRACQQDIHEIASFIIEEK